MSNNTLNSKPFKINDIGCVVDITGSLHRRRAKLILMRKHRRSRHWRSFIWKRMARSNAELAKQLMVLSTPMQVSALQKMSETELIGLVATIQRIEPESAKELVQAITGERGVITKEMALSLLPILRR